MLAIDARAGRGSGERTGFLTDPRRNAGAHSIAIVQMANEPQSAYESHYRNFSTIPALLSALRRQTRTPGSQARI